MKRHLVGYIHISVIIILILMLVSLVYTQDVYIQTQRTATKLVVVLNEWISKSGTGSVNNTVTNLSGITKYDLEFTGLFDVVTTSQDTNALLDFAFFKDLKAVVATKGTYILNGRQLEIDTDVYDVAKGSMIWQKAYEGPIDANRDMMHRFSDAVLYSFGLPGFSNSKIAYISNAKGNKEVYMMDYDGYNVVQLTDDKSIDL
ncbi:MAG: hypothetical protein ACE14V_12720, partial [bacterium]